MKNAGTDDKPLTKEDLREAFESFAQELANSFLTKDDAKNLLTKKDAKSFLTKDDAKVFLTKRDTKEMFEAHEETLKAHAESVAAHHAREVMQAIANIVEPMQVRVKNHERRISRLERSAL